MNDGPVETRPPAPAADPWSIASASAADLDTVLPLVRAYHALAGIELDDAARAAGVRALLEDPRAGTLWLIRHADALAGYIALCPGFSLEFAGRDAFVDEFFLLAPYRGRGGGRRILERIKDAARAQGIRALHLEVARDNDTARRLYQQAGFKARESYVLMSLRL